MSMFLAYLPAVVPSLKKTEFFPRFHAALYGGVGHPHAGVINIIVVSSFPHSPLLSAWLRSHSPLVPLGEGSRPGVALYQQVVVSELAELHGYYVLKVDAAPEKKFRDDQCAPRGAHAVGRVIQFIWRRFAHYVQSLLCQADEDSGRLCVSAFLVLSNPFHKINELYLAAPSKMNRGALTTKQERKSGLVTRTFFSPG